MHRIDSKSEQRVVRTYTYSNLDIVVRYPAVTDVKRALGDPRPKGPILFVFISTVIVIVATWGGWAYGKIYGKDQGFDTDASDGPTPIKFVKMMFQMPIMDAAFNLSIRSLIFTRQQFYLFYKNPWPKPPETQRLLRAASVSDMPVHQNQRNTIQLHTLSKRQLIWQCFTDTLSAILDLIPTTALSLLPTLPKLLSLIWIHDDDIQDPDYQYSVAVYLLVISMIIQTIHAIKTYYIAGTHYPPAREQDLEIELVEETPQAQQR